jgi:hypothetical protein
MSLTSNVINGSANLMNILSNDSWTKAALLSFLREYVRRLVLKADILGGSEVFRGATGRTS